MSELAKKCIELLGLLPAEERRLAYEVIKRIVIAWNPDYKNLLPKAPPEEEEKGDFEWLG